MLVALMSDIGDLFRKSLDDILLISKEDQERLERLAAYTSLQEIDNNRGIGSKLDQLSELLERQDMELFYNMVIMFDIERKRFGASLFWIQMDISNVCTRFSIP